MQEILKTIPLTSGVYLMKNAQGKVIYVGKAVSLRKRVQSYFRKSGHRDVKTARLVKDIKDIAIMETSSEAEALILEASLIKTYKPRYNISLMDDKSYPFIAITGEKFPCVSVSRPRVKNKTSKYYGPYVNPRLIREALGIIRRIFPFRTCVPFPKKECLDYHMGLCDAPCIDKMSQKDYAKNIRNICLILEGKKDAVYRNLQKEMETFVRERAFEKAAKARDQLRAIGALYSGTKDINYYKEAEQLTRALGLPRRLERIETFDISTIMGTHAVGSMVSFLQGKADKSNYRRFRIKDVEGMDDFKMMAEVVRRRYSRLKREGRVFPDLIVVDGGKGQLSAACAQLKALNIQIPIVSLAKKEEEIFMLGKRNSVKLSEYALGLKLLQRTRDEAHRFAIAYHRKLRSKAVIK